ncbi:MAG: HAD-IIA family hydrolase [Candidatus Thalassarchaeaceae archaeon]|jgi:4-nitrophenyl phosphatase/NagD protein|nr:HAD-IIA family hydrolase [Candidatus Thalassarchaeaceae archaeon]
MDSTLENIDAVFLDLDGTMYLGSHLIDGALEFLNRCESRGIRRFFLSNNSSRSVEQYLHKLSGLGIPATVDDVLLSTHDLISWLHAFDYDRVYLVGTEGMRHMLENAGLTMDAENPEIVVLGYDTEITYEKISTASIHLHNGIPMVVSHPDVVCPSPDGGLPDTGAYMAMFEATTGVKPIHVCGKPEPGMIEHKIKELGLEPARCAMVGDRLYTDMAMATRAGVKGILVLSGEATVEDVDSLPDGAEQRPSLIVQSVDELFR